MSKIVVGIFFMLAVSSTSFAGLIDPNCSPEKLAAGKLVGGKVPVVGDRCSVKETLTDTTKRSVGIDQHTKPLEEIKDTNSRIFNDDRGWIGK